MAATFGMPLVLNGLGFGGVGARSTPRARNANPTWSGAITLNSGAGNAVAIGNLNTATLILSASFRASNLVKTGPGQRQSSPPTTARATLAHHYRGGFRGFPARRNALASRFHGQPAATCFWTTPSPTIPTASATRRDYPQWRHPGGFSAARRLHGVSWRGHSE